MRAAPQSSKWRRRGMSGPPPSTRTHSKLWATLFQLRSRVAFYGQCIQLSIQLLHGGCGPIRQSHLLGIERRADPTARLGGWGTRHCLPWRSALWKASLCLPAAAWSACGGRAKRVCHRLSPAVREGRVDYFEIRAILSAQPISTIWT